MAESSAIALHRLIAVMLGDLDGLFDVRLRQLL
jgi:hypothetical protein